MQMRFSEKNKKETSLENESLKWKNDRIGDLSGSSSGEQILALWQRDGFFLFCLHYLIDLLNI